MAGEKERVEGYLGTISRLEPDIHTIDGSAFYASAAVSLKRIADAAERIATVLCHPVIHGGALNLTFPLHKEYCVGCDRAVTPAEAQACMVGECRMKT